MKIFFYKKRLKGSKIGITENLTQTRLDILKAAGDDYGKDNVWTVEGRVFASVNGVKTRIKH